MKGLVKENFVNSFRGVWSLYGAGFTMSLILSALWTAMPFIIRNIGGTEDHVGYTWAANMLGYMVCLLLVGAVLGQHNPRSATRVAVAVAFASFLVMSVLVYVVLSKSLAGNLGFIWGVIAAGTVAGAAMSLYWPFLMSWVSEDLEGTELNKRFGAYNCSWGAAAVIGPLIGGIFIESSTLLPLIFTTGGMIVCFLLLSFASDGSAQAKPFGDEETRPIAGCKDRAMLVRFRWMGRIVLFCSWVCFGIMRSQFALLFTDRGFSESMFGVLVTIFGVCNFAVLRGAGRYAFWHFKASFLPAAQGLLAVSLILVIYGHAFVVFVLAFVVMGCCFGFGYSSHLYYGACGSRKRSVRMIIHEGTISLGVIVGSGAGGYLAKNVGLYSPYWFALILVAVGLLVQAVLLLYGKLAQRATRK